MEVECKPSSKHLADEIKNKDDLLTLRSCAQTFISGATMSIIESLLVLERPLARTNEYDIELKYIRTPTEQIADILTKGLGERQHTKLRTLLTGL